MCKFEPSAYAGDQSLLGRTLLLRLWRSAPRWAMRGAICQAAFANSRAVSRASLLAL